MEEQPEIINFENSLGPWLGITTKLLDFCILDAFRRHKLDLTKEQMIVLKKLYFSDGLNQNELALITLRDKSTLTRLLSKMEKKGYIIRKTSTTDKRNKLLYITKKGKDIFFVVQPILKELMKTIHTGITEEEKQNMINTLKKIQTNLTNTSASI